MFLLLGLLSFGFLAMVVYLIAGSATLAQRGSGFIVARDLFFGWHSWRPPPSSAVTDSGVASGLGWSRRRLHCPHELCRNEHLWSGLLSSGGHPLSRRHPRFQLADGVVPDSRRVSPLEKAERPGRAERPVAFQGQSAASGVDGFGTGTWLGMSADAPVLDLVLQPGH